LALERCRCLHPGAVGLAALLCDLAPQGFPVLELCDRHERLAPVELADAFVDRSRARGTVAILRNLGLAEEKEGIFRLKDEFRDPLCHALLPIERRHGAEGAIGALEILFPSNTYESSTWPQAERMLAHAYAAAAGSER